MAAIESTVGEGTRIEIWLPQSKMEEVPGYQADLDSRSKEVARGERLLVVEDDVYVRRFMIEWLSDLGYAVSSAESAIQALQQFESVKPELIIVDYAMPELTGAEMALKLREQGFQTPIIFVTGYADMLAIESVPAPTHLLRKPFEIDALTALVRLALNELERSVATC